MKSTRSMLSRRKFLFSLGLVGATLGLCSGASAVAYLLGHQLKTRRETPIPTAPDSTPLPEPPAPQIVSREAWGALPPDHEALNENGFYSADNPEGWLIYDGELADHYQTVVIHHAAFYEADDLSTMEAIQRLHRRSKGWADIAYHFLVGRTGVIYEGRDWTVRGTHVGGYNTGSLGVCLLGNFMQQQLTDAQLASTRRLIIWVVYRLGLSHIAGHRQFNAQTQCPGDNLQREIPQFAAVANLAIGIDGYVPPDIAVPCTCCDCNPE